MKSELGGKVKKQSGGDMLSRSLKVEPSEGFNLFTYTIVSTVEAARVISAPLRIVRLDEAFGRGP